MRLGDAADEGVDGDVEQLGRGDACVGLGLGARLGSGPPAGSGLGLGFQDGSRSIRLRVSGASLVKPSKALAAPTSSREENWLGLGLESGLGLGLGLG